MAVDTYSTATSRSDVAVAWDEESQLIHLGRELSIVTNQTCIHLEINLVMYDSWIAFGREEKGAYVRDNSIQLKDSIKSIIKVHQHIFWKLSYEAKTIALSILYK